MAGPIYHFDPAVTSPHKLPAEYDRSLFLFEWERSWIREVRLTSDGALQEIRPFASHLKFRRPISLACGPDGALYLVDWYNQIISHNEVPRTHPDRDKTRGRIWRIRHRDQPRVTPPDLTRLDDTGVIARLGDLAFVTRPMTTEQFGKFVADQVQSFQAPVKASGAKL